MYDPAGSITITIQEYNELRNIRKEMEKARRIKLNSIDAHREPLSHRQKDILEFIEMNPGTSKQALVDGLKYSYARATVFKVLEELLEYQMVVQVPDSHNRQTWNLFVNENSKLVSVSKTLDIIENNFSVLLDNILRIFEHGPDDEGYGQDNPFDLAFNLLHHLSEIYMYVVNINLVCALLEWTEIKDKPTLEKLYITVFSKFANVLQKLNQASMEITESSNLTAADIIDRGSPFYLLSKEFILNLRTEANKLKLLKFVDLLLDAVWEVGYNVFKKHRLDLQVGELEPGLDLVEYKNWRDMLELNIGGGK